jgi:oxalate decarboxylase
VTVKPGGVRELHWHPNADEWQYFFGAQGRMTVFATGGRARTMDFETGDVGYIQKNTPSLHRKYRHDRFEVSGDVQE